MPNIITFGASKLVSNLDFVVEAIDKAAQQKTYAAANIVKRAWLKLLGGGRSGRVYRVPGTSRTYIASAPGESPAVMLGDLRRSIKARSFRNEEHEWEAEVGSDMEKAPMLEFGTGRRGAAKNKGEVPEGYEYGASEGMAPRPSLRPALEQTREEVKAVLRTRIF